MPDLRYRSHRSRFKVKSYSRFTAVLLVLLLICTAVVVAVAKGEQEEKETIEPAAVVVTPEATPLYYPTDTPYPFEVPAGKEVQEVLIVIDAGHGGRDPGTVSPYEKDIFEKDITLDIAKRTVGYLQGSGIKVIMTREGEDHLNDVIKEDLIARAEVANKNNATLFVSIHVNAYDLKVKGGAQVHGMEVYYMDKATPYEDFKTEQLAQTVGQFIHDRSGEKFNGIKINDYSVLRNTKMPAILIETGYITNKEDHKNLLSDDFREKTASGIAEGIKQVLDQIKAFEYNGEHYVFKEVGE